MVSTTATVLRHSGARRPSVSRPNPGGARSRRVVSCRVGRHCCAVGRSQGAADCRVLGARDLFVAQAAMTGEQTFTAFQAGINSVRWLLVRFGMMMAPVILLVNGFTKGSWAKAALFARPNF